MIVNLIRLIISLMTVVLFLSSCNGIQRLNVGTLVESTSIVVGKYTNKDGINLIETPLDLKKKKKRTSIAIEDEGLWDRIRVEDYVTIKHDRDGSKYILFVNNRLIYDHLTGSVTSLIEDEGNFYVVFQFDQIGEEIIPFNEVEWNTYAVGEQVTFSVDSRGRPLRLTSKSTK